MVCGGLLLQTLLVCGTAGSGQGTWTTKTDMPAVGNGNQACAAVGSLFYHFDVSFAPAGKGKLWKYTPTTESWASGTACACPARASMPEGSVRGVRAVNKSPVESPGHNTLTTGSYSTFLYQLDGQPFPAVTFKYDTTVDTWASVNRIPTARESAANANALAATVGDAIYVCGGQNNAKQKVEAYYPLADTWSIKQDMPQSHAGGVIGATATKIYVAGGMVPNSSAKRLDIYDVATNTWTTGASIRLCVRARRWPRMRPRP